MFRANLSNEKEYLVMILDFNKDKEEVKIPDLKGE